MEKIVIQKARWGIAKNGNVYAIIYDGQRSLSYWLKPGYSKSKFESHFIPGTVLNADVSVNKEGFFNIVNFEGEINFKNNGEATPQESLQVPQSTLPPIEINRGVKEELETSSGDFFTNLNNLIENAVNISVTKDLDALSHIEVQLSAINIEEAQRFMQNNSEAKELEVNYKGLLIEKIKELKKADEKISQTTAKDLAENELQSEKMKLVVSQNKAHSNEIISQGITNLIFSIKDRIRFISN